MAIASSQTMGHGHCRPPWRSSTTVASIQMVRCAGTPQPENKAYSVASNKPPTAPAVAAGSHRHSAGVRLTERRHSQASNKDATQANMVMCKPEIDIRCATPVARKTSQSARSIAFWSPTTKAANTPASWRLSTRAKIASRADCRVRSTGRDQLVLSLFGGASRAPVLTYPVACRPCSQSHNS